MNFIFSVFAFLCVLGAIQAFSDDSIYRRKRETGKYPSAKSFKIVKGSQGGIYGGKSLSHTSGTGLIGQKGAERRTSIYGEVKDDNDSRFKSQQEKADESEILWLDDPKTFDETRSGAPARKNSNADSDALRKENLKESSSPKEYESGVRQLNSARPNDRRIQFVSSAGQPEESGYFDYDPSDRQFHAVEPESPLAREPEPAEQVERSTIRRNPYNYRYRQQARPQAGFPDNWEPIRRPTFQQRPHNHQTGIQHQHRDNREAYPGRFPYNHRHQYQGAGRGV